MEQPPAPSRPRWHLPVLVAVVAVIAFAGIFVALRNLVPSRVSPLKLGGGYSMGGWVANNGANGKVIVSINYQTSVVNTASEGVTNVKVTYTLVNGTFDGKPSYVYSLGSIPAGGSSTFGSMLPIFGTVGPPKPDFVYLKMTLSCDDWPDAVTTYTLGVPA